MNDKKLLVLVAKGMALVFLALMACRFTYGFGAFLLGGVAFCCAITGRLGWALIGYAFFPFLVIMNPHVLPKVGLMGFALRLAPAAMTIGLMFASTSRHGHHQIPIGMIWPYLGVAAISSINGYSPWISYLKIINCAILFLGIHIGLRNVDKRPGDVMTMRSFLLVLAVFLVWGSVAIKFLAPGYAYMTSVSQVLSEEGLDAANAVIAASTGLTLFGGITNQSQTLGTILPCAMAWLVCDMIFVEKKISKVHIITLLVAFWLIYLTRSRSALVSSSGSVVLIYFYLLRRVRLRPSVKRKMRSIITMLFLSVVVFAGFMECKNHAITRWIRKTDDLAGDTRGASEAFTHSRQGKIEENLADFKRNPLLGSGFQVSEEMQYTMKRQGGLILSASIEKSILPLMVLGETGVVGAIFFVLFLIAFYSGCLKKKLYCCATLHTVFLFTNMAEATYFSPGGDGGILWVWCVGGGFLIDTIALYHRRLERIAQQQQMEWMMG